MATKEKKKLTPEQYKSLELVTKRFVLSYPHVFKKGEYQGKETNYNFTMCFKKQAPELKDDEGMKPLREKLSLAKKFTWGPDPKKWPKGIASPIQDGDEKGMEGFWLVKATSQNKIQVLEADAQTPVAEESDVYGGCICRAFIQAASYELSKTNIGVKFYAQGLQKMADGERLGGGANPRKAFEMEADEESEAADDVNNYEDDAEDDEDTEV